YADVLLCVVEEVAPHVGRDHPAVRVDVDDFALGGAGDLVAVESVRPQVPLVHAELRGNRVAVTPVRRTSGADPPLDGLDVDVERRSEVGGRYSAFKHRGP